MLQVVHRQDVVAIFVNFYRAVQIRPWSRLVIRVNFVGLHLPGINPRIGLVVGAELEIAVDPQSIDGARDETQ